MYKYKVRNIIKVYDGDTITVELDLGFGIYKIEKIRLARINAPELRGTTLNDARESRDFLRIQLQSASEVIVKTIKDRKGKYGRYIAEIYADDININDLLLKEGLAKLY